MKLVKKENIFVLICSYDERITAKDAGMRWDATGRRWYSSDVKVAKKLSAYADAETLEALEATEKKVAEKITESAATDADINIPAPAGLQYMPFQRAGIAFALNRQAILIGDEMGLGKTIQAIGTINALPDAKQILIICPASLKLNWQRECEKWLVEKRPIEIMNGKESKKESDIYIINYDILSKHDWLNERAWDIVICDESHYAKNPKAARTKACFAILKKAKRKICLTGTPIMNRPIELQGILTQLGCDFASNWFSYAKRYCAGYKSKFGWDVSGASNLDELQEKLRSTVMIRRLKKDVLTDLPAKTRQVIEIPKNGFSSALKKEEKIMKSVEEKRKMLEDLKAQAELQKDDAGFKAKIDALRETLKVDFAEISVIRHETALAKVGFTIDYLSEMLESNDKIILFAHHLDVLEKIYQAFPGIAVKFTGEMGGEQKQAAVDKFQTDAECKIFIASTMAAGVGITLTAAKLVIFHELEWTPSAISQAEDRCLAKNTLVLCRQLAYNGNMSLIPIQDIKIGDAVLTHQGRMRNVVNKYEYNHRGLITEIEYVGWFEPLICTHDHKIFVKREGKLCWIEAHKLLPTDSMSFPKEKEYNRLDKIEIKNQWRLYKTVEKRTICNVEGCYKPIEARGKCRKHYRIEIETHERPPKPLQINSRYVRLPDFIEINDDWLYLFGWFAAEGFSSIREGKSKFISFSGHIKEKHILEKLSKTLNEIGVKTSIYESKKSKSLEMRAYSGELSLWFREWFGHGASNKFLPKEILNLCPEQSEVFLRGYTDGDGYYRKKQVEWISTSKTLCYQMCLLAIRGGFIPTMRVVKSNKKNRQDQWIGGYTKNGIPGRLQDKDDNYIYRPIRSVKTYYDKIKVYDISVEEDHSFTVGFSIAHNCHRIGQKENVLIQHLVIDGSIDSMLAKKILAKQEIIEKALDKTGLDEEVEL